MNNPPTLLYTDGKNKDFIALTNQLDQEFNERFGIIQQQFDEYNTLEDIHDVILIYDENHSIACGSFKRYDAFTAEIKRVFVRKEYRGKGLSKLLMQALEEKAIEKEYKYFILETGKPLVEALALYKSMGYVIIPNYGQYQGIEISVCMKKQIIDTFTFTYSGECGKEAVFPKEELYVASQEDKELLEHTNFFMEGEIEEFLPKQYIYIYKVESEYVGLGIVLPHYSGDDVMDLGMHVAPEYRGRGIGRSIIMHLTDMCIQNRKKPVAECKIDNLESKATLLSAGYIVDPNL